MGEPVLRKKYEDTHGITDKKEKEEETYRQAKMQAQIQMDLQKDHESRSTILTTCSYPFFF